MSANRRARRRAAHPAPRRAAGAIDTYDGVPIYGGVAIDVVEAVTDSGDVADARVLLGIGPPDGAPVAYVTLCPCEGVRGVLRDLQTAGAKAAEHHPTHHDHLPGWPG